MTVEVRLGDLGTSATLSLWHVRAGDPVEAGERLVEVAFPGATVDVSAPATGVLAERCVTPGQAVTGGSLLAVIAVA